MSVKVPFKTLKFGAYQVTVRKLKKADADKNWGLYWPFEHQMDLQGEYPNKQRAAETALHEALHVIWEERGLKASEKEEQAVTGLAKGIVAFFRDNPEFRKWFMRCCA
jgi:hypothetical protein